MLNSNEGARWLARRRAARKRRWYAMLEPIKVKLGRLRWGPARAKILRQFVLPPRRVHSPPLEGRWG
jgi:hypothetical protein